MVYSFHFRRKAVVAAVASLLLLALAGLAEGQVLQGPDLGLWFRHELFVDERKASGAGTLVVDQLLEDGSFAAAGLREGDRIVSVDGRPIDSEPQFVRSVMSSSNGDHVVRVVVARTVLSGTAQSNTILSDKVQQQTISLKARDVWKGVVAADPFYQAGFLVDESLMDKGDRDGVAIARVFPLTPAFYAGLRQADILTRVSGQPVTSGAEVAQYFRVGGRRLLVVRRGGETRQLHILLPGRTFSATAYPSAGRVQSPPPHVPALQPPPPLLIPPQIPGPLSPIRSALPPDTQRPLPF